MRYLSIKTLIHTTTKKQGWIIFPYDSNQKILRLSYACDIKIARQNSCNNKPIINENKSYLINLRKYLQYMEQKEDEYHWHIKNS